MKELTFIGKAALETIDLSDCTELTKAILNNNAIDFSAGKPQEWRDSFTGTINIADQSLIFRATQGETERTIGVGETFVDDFKITTANGTDLSTPEKWAEFRGKHQASVTGATDIWIVKNNMDATIPVVRDPAFNKAVDTSASGVKTITYSVAKSDAKYRELYDKLNYSVKLTVGDGTQGEVNPDTLTLTVVQANGNAFPKAGLAKTYMDTAFLLGAKLSNGGAVENITWKIYSDISAENASDAVLALTSDGLFEIKSVGEAYVTATVTIDEKQITSVPAKVYINPRSVSLNLTSGRTKTYGVADAVNCGVSFSSYSLNGYTAQYEGIYFTRSSGEDVGKYQIFLYDPVALGVTATYNPAGGNTEFWAEYKEKACAKFQSDNPNLKLSLTVGADVAGNYTINQATVKTSASVLEKTYDATRDAVLAGAAVTGILASDIESGGVIIETLAQFDSPNVRFGSDGKATKTDYTISVTISGDKAKNYKPDSNTSENTWTVEADGTIKLVRHRLNSQTIKSPSINLVLDPIDKVYDGTTAASFESQEMFERNFLGLCEIDQANIASIRAEFLDANAGTDKTVVLKSDLIALENYTIRALTATIEPLPLSVEGLTTRDKVYDGTVDANIYGTPTIDLEHVLEGDEVAISTEDALVGEFLDKNVGNNKSVVVKAGLGLTGADAGNYYLKPLETLQANITPAILTIIPDPDQFVSLGAVDPVFTYTTSGMMPSDITAELKIRGALGRVPGDQVGEYPYTLGTLAINPNYTLELAEDAPTFAIRDTDATLSSLNTSSGALTPAFDPEVESYIAMLPMGTTNVPAITAEAAKETATVVITPAADLTGSTTVVVTAADEITTKTYTVSFRVAEAVGVTANVVNASEASSDGMIIASATGGLGEYLFKLNDGDWQTLTSFEGLAAADYTLYVADADDENNTASIVVTIATKDSGASSDPIPAPTTLTADPETADIPYSADFMKITLTAGGVDGAAYRYYIFDGNGTVNGNILTVTEAGTVTVHAQSIKNGVMSEDYKSLSIAVTKADAVTLNANVTDVTVYGGTNGSITVTANGGLGSYQYRLGNGAWQDSGSFTKLVTGSYTVYVRDAADPANIASDTVRVEQANASDSVAINAVLADLDIGDTSMVTDNLTLPTLDIYGGNEVEIEWISSDTLVLKNDGTVRRPSYNEGDRTVTLTATLRCGDIVKTKTFVVTVARTPFNWLAWYVITENRTYSINVPNTDGGVVLSSADAAKKGETVVIFASPDKDYALDRLAVYDAHGNALTLTEKDGDLYSFTMPGTRVLVDAEFTKLPPVTEPEDKPEEPEIKPVILFTDVDEDSDYYDAICWAVEHSVTTGSTATTFSPLETCTRAQAVTFLWRAAGSPEPTSYEHPFTDLDEDEYYFKAVLWAVEKGITNGATPTTFGTELPVSRAQVVTFLWRLNGEPQVAGKDVFTDLVEGEYYVKAVKWAVANGITLGTTPTTFGPDDDCNRSQIVTFLYRNFVK